MRFAKKVLKWCGRQDSGRTLEDVRNMAEKSGSRRSDCQLKAVLAALSLVLFMGLSSAAMAQGSAPDPDTPVSSDTPVTSDASQNSTSSGDTSSSPAPGSSSDATSAQEPAPAPGTADGATAPGSSGAESGSQAKANTVSHEQETKDRMFVDATFIGVAIIMCVLAVFLFMSLPKQPKKAGSDNQKDL